MNSISASLVLLGLLCAGFASASLQISVTTDKPVYQMGETINVSITVINSGSTSEKLYGGYYFTTYIIDDAYNWADRFAPQVILQTTFQPGETKMWEMAHEINEWQEYPLTVGMHSLVGGAGFTLLSDPVEFEVIPEPTSILLLGAGLISLRKNNRSQRN